MTEILVTPQQLHQLADDMDTAAATIRSATAEVASSVYATTAAENFQGQRATELLQRFRALQNNMEDWEPYLKQLAAMMRAAAIAFERADRKDGVNGFAGGGSGGGGGGGWSGGWGNEGYQFDAGEWLKDLNKWADLDETARHELIKRINMFLLDNNPEIKPEWMKFLHDNGYFAIGQALGGGLDILADGGDPITILEAIGTTAAAYGLGKSPGFDFLNQTIGGLADFARTGETAEIFEGILKGGTYALVPGAKEIMALNAGVQVIGHGACAVVDFGADYLAYGDPVMAQGFRNQAAELGDALDRMDLDNAFDVTADNLDAFLRGEQDFGTSIGNTLEGYGGILEGGAEVFVEGGSMYLSVTGSAAKGLGNLGMDLLGVDEGFQAQFNANADAFITSAQNIDIADVGVAANQMLDTGGDLLVEGAHQVDTMLDQAGSFVQNLLSF